MPVDAFYTVQIPMTQTLSLRRNVVREESFVNLEKQCAELSRENCHLQIQLEKMTDERKFGSRST